jgi:restriction system protein
MAKRKASGIRHILWMHWPVGILLGVVAYAGTRYGIGGYVAASAHTPHALTGRPSDTYALLAWLLLGACWFGALLSCIGLRQRMHRLEVRNRLDELCDLAWPEFKALVTEAFRRRGYAVEETVEDDIEGEADLILHRGGAATVVRCRQWRSRQIDVKAVREMHELMLHHHAVAVKIVAVGDYTAEAWSFVAGKRFELIYGEALLDMVREAQAAQVQRAPTPTAMPTARRTAPCPVRLVQS